MITVLISANDGPLDFIACELLKPQRENTLKNQFFGMKPRDMWFQPAIVKQIPNDKNYQVLVLLLASSLMFDCGIKQPNGQYGEKPVSPRGYEPRSYTALDNKYNSEFGLGAEQRGLLHRILHHTPLRQFLEGAMKNPPQQRLRSVERPRRIDLQDLAVRSQLAVLVDVTEQSVAFISVLHFCCDCFALDSFYYDMFALRCAFHFMIGHCSDTQLTNILSRFIPHTNQKLKPVFLANYRVIPLVNSLFGAASITVWNIDL